MKKSRRCLENSGSCKSAKIGMVETYSERGKSKVRWRADLEMDLNKLKIKNLSFLLNTMARLINQSISGSLSEKPLYTKGKKSSLYE